MVHPEWTSCATGGTGVSVKHAEHEPVAVYGEIKDILERPVGNKWLHFSSGKPLQTQLCELEENILLFGLQFAAKRYAQNDCRGVRCIYAFVLLTEERGWQESAHLRGNRHYYLDRKTPTNNQISRNPIRRKEQKIGNPRVPCLSCCVQWLKVAPNWCVCGEAHISMPHYCLKVMVLL